MNSLKRGYIKKALVFPLVMIVIAIILCLIFVPKIVSSLPTAASSQYVAISHDTDAYPYKKDFDTFEDLKLNRFVGWVVSEDIGIDCALTYNSEDEDTDASSLLPESTDPWDNGCMMIIGANDDVEFRNLHSATLGDKISVEIYNKGTYTYKITNTQVNVTRDEIKNYKQDNSLILCRPYKNFEQDGSYFYAIYVATLIES